MQFSFIPNWVQLCLLTVPLTLPLLAVPNAEIQQDQIVLSNAGAKYRFTVKAPYSLMECHMNGVNTGMTKFGYALMDSDLSWTNDIDLGKWSYTILRDKESITLQTMVNGPDMRLLREYTLSGSSPAMKMRFRAEYDKPGKVRWAFLFGTRLPANKPFLRLFSEVHNGRISTCLRMISNNHFLDQEGNLRKIQGSLYDKWEDVFLIGSYDPDKKIGFLAMTNPELTPWPMQVRQESKEKIGFNVAPYVFSIDKDGKRFQEVRLTFVPFQGDFSVLNKTIVEPFVARLKACGFIHAKPQTARLISSGNLDVWTDLADARVYPSENAPKVKTTRVEIFAARGERESFQLALRSSEPQRDISLQPEPLTNVDKSTRKIELQWNPVMAEVAGEPYRGDNCCYGEIPDVLGYNKSVDLSANRTQSFYLTATIPEDTVAGVYKGNVKILSAGKEIASVPVFLRVWRFSLVERTFVAALDWWHRQMPRKEMLRTFAETGDIVIRNNGGLRWVASPQPEWNDDGTLKRVDYTKFDVDMETAQKRFRHNLVVCRAYMLGYDHRPKNTLFGSAKMILKPSYNAKLEAFTKDFRAHLIKKDWNGKVIMDMFDEPLDQYYDMINQVVTRIRAIAPEWKFTYAGAYAPALEASINFWNLPVYMATTDYMKRAKALGAEMTVYNFPYSAVTENPTAVRGLFAHLYNKNIRYFYQWIVNWWPECGYNGDFQRRASIVRLLNGHVCSTQRMEAAGSGIEDYEYAVRLRQTVTRLMKSNPAIAKQAEALLEEMKKLAWSTKYDEVCFVPEQNPARYEEFHRRAGEILDQAEGL